FTRHVSGTSGIPLGPSRQWVLATRPHGGVLPESCDSGHGDMALRPIFELGVAEAYDILIRQFGVVGLPPLDAIENEDWGRDYLLSRLIDFPPKELAAAGLIASTLADKELDA